MKARLLVMHARCNDFADKDPRKPRVQRLSVIAMDLSAPVEKSDAEGEGFESGVKPVTMAADYSQRGVFSAIPGFYDCVVVPGERSRDLGNGKYGKEMVLDIQSAVLLGPAAITEGKPAAPKDSTKI